ncbi:MAG: sugar-binding transcriptional regulator [Actinomycetaceae bacterium]|nr:sugar-binding transcriptional regulator [Actinomycetaceae bacterium]
MSPAEPLSQKDVQAIDAAKFYYEGGLSQVEVSEKMGFSRPTISKLLQHANQRGFVKISVVDPRLKDNSVAQALQEKFGLAAVRVVYPASGGEAELRTALGQAGAQLLQETVRDGDVVGVAWSRTVCALTTALEQTPRRNVKVVQLRGTVGDYATGFTEVQTIGGIARAFGAEPFLLGVPGIFHSLEAKTAVEHEKQVQEVLRLGCSARVAVFSVGGAAQSSYLMSAPALSKRERDHLQACAVGDICSRFVDANGRICLPDLNNRTVGLSLPQLRRISQKILVAGGSDKAGIIRAALEHNYVSQLVIDAQTARKILQ